MILFIHQYWIIGKLFFDNKKVLPIFFQLFQFSAIEKERWSGDGVWNAKMDPYYYIVDIAKQAWVL